MASLHTTLARFLFTSSLVASACTSTAVLAQNESTLEIMDAINSFRAEREKRIVQDFAELLSFPNVATNLDDMTANANHIMGLLDERGFGTQVLQSGGAPYVYAELLTPGAEETLLIYAHFDGQPVQVENWAYPPFQPTLLDAPVQNDGQVIDIDGVTGAFDPEWRIYARSAGDDKMPIVAMIHVLDALRANNID